MVSNFLNFGTIKKNLGTAVWFDYNLVVCQAMQLVFFYLVNKSLPLASIKKITFKVEKISAYKKYE